MFLEKSIEARGLQRSILRLVMYNIYTYVILKSKDATLVMYADNQLKNQVVIFKTLTKNRLLEEKIQLNGKRCQINILK